MGNSAFDLLAKQNKFGKSDNTIYDNFTDQFDELIENYQSHADAYTEAKDKIDEYTSSIETNQNRLEELIDAKNDAWNGEYTLAQKAEVDNLEKENEKLEQQIKLQEKLAKAEADAAIVEINKKSDTDIFGSIGTGLSRLFFGDSWEKRQIQDEQSGGKSPLQLRLDEAKDYTERITKLNEIIKKEQSDLLKYDVDTDAYKTTFDDLKKNQEELSEIQVLMGDVITDLENWQTLYEQIGKTNPNIEKALKLYNQLDMSDSEKILNNIETFFEVTEDGDGNALYDYLVKARKAGKILESELNKLGLTLSDIGDNVDSNSLQKYFDSIVNSTNEASASLKQFEGTYDEIKNAQDTEHLGAEYENISEYLHDYIPKRTIELAETTLKSIEKTAAFHTEIHQ